MAFAAAAVLPIAGSVSQAAPAVPAFVQARANEVTSGTSSSVTLASPTTAGNLIVVYVLWSNTAAVSISDSRGDAYAIAAPRTTWGSSWSAQGFYAKNVVGGPTTVTASFATAVGSFGVVYVHEYSGVDKVAPVDVTKSATGTSTAMSTGSVATTNPSDLFFAVSASNNKVTKGGSGYTTRSTAYGNRTEDRNVTTAGSYSATATQNGSAWVMQLLAFKADSGTGDSAPPSVPTGLGATPASTTQINLGWTASTDNVGVTAYRVFRNGTQVGTSSTTSYQDSGLAPATTYSYAVAALDAAGNQSAQSPPVSATTQSPPVDTTPPTVAITAPAANAQVSSTVMITADASDNVGVTGVQFSVDGVSLGAEDVTAPYSISWNSTGVGNRTHLLTARARDAAGNSSTTAGTTVTVSNTAPPAGGPAASYAFDEGAGTSASDASGHGLTGTLTNGPTWGAGKYGTAVHLDGVNDYVTLGNTSALRLTGSMTISAWVNAAAFPADDAAVVSKRGSVGYQLDTTVDRGARTIGFKLTNSSGQDMLRYGATTLTTAGWHHIAGVYDGAAGTMHVYLNGQLDDGALVGTVTATQQDSSQDVYVGERPGGGSFFFHGSIDDVRIYGRPLTASEIRTDMGTPLGSGGSSDPTAPTVAITGPAASAQVNDIVTVTADATDNVGVSGVQFLVDGVAAGAEDTTAPYGLQWDTRAVPNGARTLTARARDAAGNSTVSAPIIVNVANTSSFQNEVLATGFNLPTSIEFLPDGRMLIVELAGKIWVLPPPYTQPDPTPFLQITNIGSAGVQQGIYDIALDPSFATNHYYYVFYTLGSPNRDRLSRFTANAAITGTVAGSELVLYQDGEDANAEHHGGAINFGNDGKLYFTTGEHFVPSEAQLLTNPRGKIHRINKDGTIPTDNPYYDGAGPNVDSIWAYGLRNPYRAYYDAPTGRFFIGDVGGNVNSTAKEEVNIGVRGANYGWPDSEGPCTGQCTSPIYWYPHNGRDACVTGGFVYHGSQFPAEYRGSYFFADYTQNWIRRMTFDANGNVTGVVNFEPADGSVDGPYGDIVYLTEGPDGALYYVDLGYSDVGGTFGVSKIRRIRYLQANQAPVAIASGNPTSGPAPLAVSFSSAGSSDPEGQPLTYSWTFGDGGTSTAANPTHTYTQAGQYSARLTVSDGVNSTLSLPITVSAGQKPVAAILTPQDGSFFVAGDVISYSGSATDADDGTLPASAFTWNIDFLHEGHVHPGTPVTGVKSGSFTIPTSGHDFSGNTRYRITLTVTDSSGLIDTKSVTIWPTKVNLSFDTSPTGMTLYLDGIAKSTPFVYDTLVGFTHTIEGRNQTLGSTTYTFSSWSDGGAQMHSIVVRATNQSYVATFQVNSGGAPPGLAAAYAFNEGSGTTAADASGHGLIGTLTNGGTWNAGRYGSAVQLDGTNDFVNLGNPIALQITGSMTVSAWVFATAFPFDDAAVVSKRNGTEIGYQLDTTIDAGPRTIGFKLTGASGGAMFRYGATGLQINTWYHIAGVYDAATGTINVYLNGQLDNGSFFGATASSQQNSPSNVNIGQRASGNFSFNGRIDDVRIYSRALTQTEIQLDMNTPLVAMSAG